MPKEIDQQILLSDEELISLATEFKDDITLCNATDTASPQAIAAARRLVQHSFNDHCIVIPDNVQTIWAGEGSGEWLPAMVFIPNCEIF